MTINPNKRVLNLTLCAKLSFADKKQTEKIKKLGKKTELTYVNFFTIITDTLM